MFLPPLIIEIIMKKFAFFKGFARVAALLSVALIAGVSAAALTSGKNSAPVASSPSAPSAANHASTYASPYVDYVYGFEFEAFKVTYDLRANRTMDVTMDLTVHYTGYQSTGFIHDIPVNAGDRVRHISAYEVNSNGEDGYLSYTIDHDLQNFVSVNMGDSSRKTGQTHRYRIYYEYAITKPVEKNVLYLNAIGYGSEANISGVEITYNLPDGFKSATYYMGYKSEDNTEEHNDFKLSEDKKTLTLTKDELAAYNGITFALTFDDGVLSTKPDNTPYYVIIGGCVLLAFLFAFKFLIFNKDGLTPVVNVEAPNQMGPLVMGKLIDNKVDQSDVTSLIFYWADKGHLKIDLDDPDNIELIRISQKLPDSAPRHEKIMYNNLFLRGDIVRVNSLANSFYTTVETVTKEVNAENGKLYDGKSMAVAVIFALLGGLIMALTPIILAKFLIGWNFGFIAPLFMIVPAFIIFAISQGVKYNWLKYSKKKLTLSYLLIIFVAALITLAYVFIVPSYVIEILPKILICAVSFTIIILSTLIISRTPAYTEKLNDIVGFREFILTVEKEKLEMMLEQNPEFYYHILPYAIVLGVSDIWADKFKALTIAPPSWCTTRYHNGMFNFVVFHTTIKSVNTNMTKQFTSRPSSNSLSGGGGHGGSFGGHGGGGHGGGGFRGR